MIDATGLIAVLDANVLYPAPVRDILLHLADVKLFQPKWTDLIHDEWIRNVLINRPDIKSESLKKHELLWKVLFRMPVYLHMSY